MYTPPHVAAREVHFAKSLGLHPIANGIYADGDGSFVTSSDLRSSDGYAQLVEARPEIVPLILERFNQERSRAA